MMQWVNDGADPSLIQVPKLKDDLLSLLKGRTITDSFDGKIIKPSNYIILEEPSGRERQEIKEYIDLEIFIDVPQDVCVIRNLIIHNLRYAFFDAQINIVCSFEKKSSK